MAKRNAPEMPLGNAVTHDEVPNPPLSSPAPDAGRAHPLRIVVADGDPSIRSFYQECLTRRGHQLCFAQSAQQLVLQCGLLSPDLVITDVRLPTQDGSALGEVCQVGPIPIILVTDPPDGEWDGWARDNPYVLACLVKPVKENALAAAVALAVQQFKRFESLRQEAAGLRQALEDRKVIEKAKGILMKRLRLDEQDAFRRMRMLASSQNRQLIEVCRQIIAVDDVFGQIQSIPGGK